MTALYWSICFAICRSSDTRHKPEEIVEARKILAKLDLQMDKWRREVILADLCDRLDIYEDVVVAMSDDVSDTDVLAKLESRVSVLEGYMDSVDWL